MVTIFFAGMARSCRTTITVGARTVRDALLERDKFYFY